MRETKKKKNWKCYVIFSTNDDQDCMMHTQMWRSSVLALVLCFSPALMEQSFCLSFIFFPSLSVGSKSWESFCPFLSFWALIIVFPLMLSKARINCVPLSPVFLSLSTALSVDDGPSLPCMKLKVIVSSKYSPPFLSFFFSWGKKKKNKTHLFPRTRSRTQATLFLCTQCPRLSATSLSLLVSSFFIFCCPSALYVLSF